MVHFGCQEVVQFCRKRMVHYRVQIDSKSCHDRSGGRVRRRDVRSVARDIAETLSAMANADGGTVGSAWKTTARASSAVV